jgi:hypothetical protein
MYSDLEIVKNYIRVCLSMELKKLIVDGKPINLE